MLKILSVLGWWWRPRRGVKSAPLQMTADERVVDELTVAMIFDGATGAIAAARATGTGNAEPAIELATDHLRHLGFTPGIEDLELLADAIDSLPEPHVRFIREFRAGKSTEQIASEFGVDRETVRRGMMDAWRRAITIMLNVEDVLATHRAPGDERPTVAGL